MKALTVFFIFILFFYQVYSQDTIYNIIKGEQPQVTYIWPNSGSNDDVITMKIYGEGFIDGMYPIQLSKPGYNNINSTNTVVHSSNYITCDFDLSNVSTTTYNLVVYNDTVYMCFNVNKNFSNVYSEYFWDHENIFYSLYSGYTSLALGDADNDGLNEVYGSQDEQYSVLYQYKWTISGWIQNVVFVSPPYWNSMRKMKIGDGDNDKLNEIYAACGNGCLYQFKWNGSSWLTTIIDNVYLSSVVVGDGDNDGLIEIYGIGRYIYKYQWNGSTWVKSLVDICGSGYYDDYNDASIGDGNNDGLLEIYGCCENGHIYQLEWYNNTNTWVRTDIGTTGHSERIKVGDGDNDGLFEVYFTSNNDKLYMYRYIGNNWVLNVVAEVDHWGMQEVDVSDGDNDGYMEVYSTGAGGNLFQIYWNGNQWIKISISQLEYFGAIGIGDVKNSGLNEILGACVYSQGITEFFRKPMYFRCCSDTIYCLIFDSTVYNLNLKNVSSLNLVIDSINSPLSEFSINSFYPETITTGESLDINILFKPLFQEHYLCSLVVFLNDSLFRNWLIVLHGWGDSSYSSIVDLIQPSNNGFSNASVEFFWHTCSDNFPGLVNYTLQYSTDSTFVQSVYEYTRRDTFFYITIALDSTYFWRIKVNDSSGVENPWSNIWKFLLDHNEIEEDGFWDSNFTYSVNIISDFKALFDMQIAEQINLSIKIFDISGREVAELFSGNLKPGNYKFPFTPEKNGLFFYILVSGENSYIGKILIIR